MNNIETDLECLESGKNNCAGEVDYRPAMSPTGKWFPRCDKHFAEREKIQRGISQRYNLPMYY